MSKKIRRAMKTLKKAMKKDSAYAYSWHCNVAMMCYDAIQHELHITDHYDAHRVGNEAASRFMKLAFDVDTKFEGNH